jgi:hypothetical protein
MPASFVCAVKTMLPFPCGCSLPPFPVIFFFFYRI